MFVWKIRLKRIFDTIDRKVKVSRQLKVSNVSKTDVSDDIPTWKTVIGFSYIYIVSETT
jgi:hypothetical protein